MTRLVLTSGGTELVGEPVCTGDTTSDHWTCTVSGRETVGPYAGRRLTYHCTPSYKPQPNGQSPALMVDCSPLVAAPAPG
jgi:hypothetical protein